MMISAKNFAFFSSFVYPDSRWKAIEPLMQFYAIFTISILSIYDVDDSFRAVTKIRLETTYSSIQSKSMVPFMKSI